jgi:hypothetical protein
VSLGVVHGKAQNSLLSGRILFGIAALTVVMGRLTTWLKRSFIATLHRT